MHRAVIFDLDGTLLDTLRDLGEATNAVLRRRGFPEHAVDEYRLLVGEGMSELVRKALPEAAREPAVVTAALAELRREYAVAWPRHTHPYPGVPALLDALAGRGVRMAVLSNKADEFTREMVARLLPPRFEAVRGATEGAPRKPDPTVALALGTTLGVPPGETLFVGDTRIDMDTARGAGMVPVGVRWGFRGEEELRAHGATRVLEHPAELLALL